MNANVVGILGTIVIPSAVICLVFVVTFVNLYLNIRRRFPAKVNCWFCNADARVPYDDSNSFVCPTCRQYNGFTADGDYNREIPEQYQQRLNNYCYHQPSNVTDDTKWGNSASRSKTPHNSLCFGCNRNQELKIHQLASFVPEYEENYNTEVEEYRKQLEQAYKLCGRCERVLKRTLNDVKRNILGSKLAQIGSKSLTVLDMHMRASTKQKARLKRQRWAKVCVYAIIGLLLMKLFHELSDSGWTVADLMLFFPTSLLTGITMVLSYALAIIQLISTYFEKLLAEPAIQQTTERIETVGNELLQRYAPQLLQTSSHLYESFSAQVPNERNSSILVNVAIMALGALLSSLGSQRTAVKQMLILALCTADCILKYMEYQNSTVHPSLLLTLGALVLEISCIGQRVVRSDVVGSDINTSFHKIYSQQCSENDYSDADTTVNTEQQSPAPSGPNLAPRCSAAANTIRPSNLFFMEPPLPTNDAGANLSRKSLDTTASGSLASSSSISPTNSFFTNSCVGNSGKVSGSLFNIAETTQPRLDRGGSVFLQRGSPPSGSLLKTPSFSVDNFQVASIEQQARWKHRQGPPSIASGRLSQFRFSTSTINQEADGIGQDAHDPLIEDDIDRLSISGRVSMNTSLRAGAAGRVSLGNGNPFAQMKLSKAELAFDEISSAGLRRRYHDRPPSDTLKPTTNSLWSGVLATGVNVSGGQQVHMSRTSSQSSGFESQVDTTRRNTPTEADALTVYTTPEAAPLAALQAPPSPAPSSASMFHNQTGITMDCSQARSLFKEKNLFNHALQQHPDVGSSGLFFPTFSHYGVPASGFSSAASTVNRHIFPPQQSRTPSFHRHHHQQQTPNLAGVGSGSCLSLHSNQTGFPFSPVEFPGKLLPPERPPHPSAGASFYTPNQSTASSRAGLLNLSKLANEHTNGTLPTA